MTVVAVMQPYFIPYLGYFRLFQAADIFVALDCVQFPRRGLVHRNRLSDEVGRLRYLTLPLKRTPRATRIDELHFREDSKADLMAQMRKFPALRGEWRDAELGDWLTGFDRRVVDYLVAGLRLFSRRLGVERPVYRSSELKLPDRLRGQERILAIVRAFGGDAYVNAPGGRQLYDANAFRQCGINLGFLKPFDGGIVSICERIGLEDRSCLMNELARTTEVDWTEQT